MEDSPVSFINAIFRPFGTTTSTLSTHHHNKVSLLSLSQIGTSRVSTPLTRMTPWLSPSSLQTS